MSAPLPCATGKRAELRRRRPLASVCVALVPLCISRPITGVMLRSVSEGALRPWWPVRKLPTNYPLTTH